LEPFWIGLRAPGIEKLAARADPQGRPSFLIDHFDLISLGEEGLSLEEPLPRGDQLFYIPETQDQAPLRIMEQAWRSPAGRGEEAFILHCAQSVDHRETSQGMFA